MYECKDTSKRLLADQPTNEKDNNSQFQNNQPPSYPHDGSDGDEAVTPTEAGAIYRKATTPSAPVLDTDIYPNIHGQHFYDRSDSVPVQAST